MLKYGHYKKLLATLAMNSGLNLKEAHDKIDIIEKGIKKYDSSISYITIHMCPYNGGKNER